MKFLALLVALLLEQARPLRYRNQLYQWFGRYAAVLEDRFDGGQYHHGAVAWMLGAGPLLLVTLVVDQALRLVMLPLAWTWSIGVLYVTMGFRRVSNYYTQILRALASEDHAGARGLLSEWRGESAADLSPTEIARVTIEQGLLASHRYVFGPIVWFVLLGPGGAVLYRAAEMLAVQWNDAARPRGGDFGRFAARLFVVLDWIPARLTALTFAVVGNFEDAVYCWRSQALAWNSRTQGVILAAGAGALGVRLGDALHQHGTLQYRPELGTGGDADVDAMDAAVRLIWRSLVLWMFLVLIVSLAHALG